VTELVWEGKYREGTRVAPVRIALPFQTVETVNASARDRARTLDLFARGRPTGWRNRLIWGDKTYVLPSLLADPDVAGKVDLVYIDPPFDTGADFSFTTPVPHCDKTITKTPSVLEMKAYRDTWGRGLDSYVHWFHETAALLKELLSDEGKLFVHCDWRVNSYIRCILDEVFGAESFRNEIIWRRAPNLGRQAAARQLGRVIDTIYVYSKAPGSLFRGTTPIRSEAVEVDREGKPKGAMWDAERRLFYTTAPRGDYTDESIAKLRAEGRVHDSATGGISIKYFLRKGDDGKWYKDQPVDTLWDDFQVRPLRHRPRGEDLGYDTQKPEGLLERIITWSTREGDLVLDCFCGSGTTAAVAEKSGRRWIACDLSRFAIHTTRKRLLGIPGVRPFLVQNLGKYERQAWMSAEFEKPEDRAATENAYRRFILDLYRAEPISGYAWLHGAKGGRFVHVGAVDVPVTLADVTSIAGEVRRACGKANDGDGAKAAVDVLGWEFAFELHELATQAAAGARVDVSVKRIPSDVLDKKALKDIQAKDFFELRALSVQASVDERVASVALVDFMMPSEDLPEDVRKAVKHWSQWIDYWAIDWDFKNETFHNEWQSYRTRDAPGLQLVAQREYREPGTYTVVVKVIDLLGCDTTKRLSLEVT
jgi:adenine-specific DNA-methyltransferase